MDLGRTRTGCTPVAVTARGLFVEQFGVPPIALLARLRVREMARLLRESDMTIAEIGVRVGWRNRGHAAEQFAKIMGVTPTAYRNQYHQRTRQTI